MLERRLCIIQMIPSESQIADSILTLNESIKMEKTSSCGNSCTAVERVTIFSGQHWGKVNYLIYGQQQRTTGKSQLLVTDVGNKK